MLKIDHALSNLSKYLKPEVLYFELYKKCLCSESTSNRFLRLIATSANIPDICFFSNRYVARYSMYWVSHIFESLLGPFCTAKARILGIGFTWDLRSKLAQNWCLRTITLLSMTRNGLTLFSVQTWSNATWSMDQPPLFKWWGSLETSSGNNVAQSRIQLIVAGA